MTIDTLDVILAADDVFAMPLTVSARSAVDAAAPGTVVRITVIDCGISGRNRRRILRSLAVGGTVVRIVPFAREVPRAALHGGIIPSVATYARLFAADHAPDAARAVYLDSDTVVRADLLALVAELPDGALVAGVLDDQADGRAYDIDRLRPLLDPTASDSPYVNAGVLVLDLEAWRREGLSDRFQELITSTLLEYADQDAINVVCAGRIHPVPARWNSQTHVAELAAADDAAVVHYTKRPKPWHLGGDVPAARHWYEVVDRTAWRGWRPTRRRVLVPKVRRAARIARLRAEQLVGRLRSRA